MIHKNFLISKNVIITVLKIVFGIYLLSLLTFMIFILLSSIPDKIHFFTIALLDFLPIFVLYFLFIAAFYGIMSYFLRIEIITNPSANTIQPTKMWNLLQNGSLSETFQVEHRFPITKTMFIIPQSKKGKKISTFTMLPLHLLTNSNLFFRFFNLMRFTIPESLEQDDIVIIPYGGLINKETNIPGDLYLHTKFLSRVQVLFFSIAQISTVLIPAIIYFAFLAS